jgi:hypothetical protein
MPVIPEPFLRSDYDGLNTTESDILRKFLRRRDEPVRRLETQVRVGPGELLPEAQPESFRKSWRESSKLKIDAVIERPSTYEIVELKDFGRTSFLGQLLMYRYWFELERDLDKPVELYLATFDVNPSAVQPSRFEGVQMVLLSAEGRDHFAQGAEAVPPFDGTQ